MESSKNLEVIRNSDYIIGDLEQMRLTSKTYVIKRAVQKKFWNKPLIMVFLVIIALYVSILLLHPFIKNIKNMIVREMSEQNGNLGLNQNYERVSPYDKNYTYIPIVGTDDIHGYFFPQINSIRIEEETLKYKTGGLEYIAKYINILREEFGPHRVLYFDGGDFYQGGID
jgi:hypothetical protein